MGTSYAGVLLFSIWHSQMPQQVMGTSPGVLLLLHMAQCLQCLLYSVGHAYMTCLGFSEAFPLFLPNLQLGSVLNFNPLLKLNAAKLEILRSSGSTDM